MSNARYCAYCGDPGPQYESGPAWYHGVCMEKAKLEGVLITEPPPDPRQLRRATLPPNKEGYYHPTLYNMAWADRKVGEWWVVPAAKVGDHPEGPVRGARSLREQVKNANKRMKGRAHFQGFVDADGAWVTQRTS